MDLSADDPRHAYLRIADELRRAIETGELQPGDKLPSARELMDRNRVASHTVQSALKVLQGEDLTYSVHGRGTYVRDDLDVSALPAANGTAPEHDTATAIAELTAAVRAMGEEVASLRTELQELRADLTTGGAGGR